jgi:hypothetical protein
VRYGEDSDWFRVRVLGLPPHADELQFIDFERIQNARGRAVEVLGDEPLVAGFDVSGGGAAWNVIRFRRGLDARSYPAIRITGEAGRDRNLLVGRAAEILKHGVRGTRFNAHNAFAVRSPVEALFVDSAFGAPVVERLHALGFRNVHEISFGGPPSFTVHRRAAMGGPASGQHAGIHVVSPERVVGERGDPGRGRLGQSTGSSRISHQHGGQAGD